MYIFPQLKYVWARGSSVSSILGTAKDGIFFLFATTPMDMGGFFPGGKVTGE
jgi:predicted RNase H-like HicB family nuclease